MANRQRRHTRAAAALSVDSHIIVSPFRIAHVQSHMMALPDLQEAAARAASLQSVSKRCKCVSRSIKKTEVSFQRTVQNNSLLDAEISRLWQNTRP